MKQIFLALVLIAFPVAAFTAVEMWLFADSPVEMDSGDSGSLGDLSAYKEIVNDTRHLSDSGKFSAAEQRITDFETKWDDAESGMRPKAPAAWGNVDAAADAAFTALRRSNPVPEKVKDALDDLSAVLNEPLSRGNATDGVKQVSGVAVTDPNGHAIPCEAMLSDLRAALSNGSISPANKAKANNLEARAVERCNADDDKRADAFAAKALALIKQ